MKNTLFQKDFISTEKLTTDDIALIFERSDEMRKIVDTKGSADILKGKIMAALFYEPSSRTFSSFITAMQRLGGGIIPLNGMTNTSVAKGETLEDTVRVFSSYADVLVMRHPEAGSLSTAAQYASVPVLNAGEGALGEHPTQACIDLYTIQKKLGEVNNLNILIIGDLAHYRPTNSLLKLLANYPNVTINLATPPEVPIQDSLRTYLKQKKVKFQEHTEFSKILPIADVLYVTRVKKEYMSEVLYHKIKGSYRITGGMAQSMKKKSIIMHCLPRIDEIATEVDKNSRSVYLSDQVRNGLYVRMALLSLILKK